MSILITLVIFLLSVAGSKHLFGKWFNHIIIYSGSWTLFIVLYELKLIKYIDVRTETWIIIIAVYAALLLGTLTVFSMRSLAGKKKIDFTGSWNFELALLKDDGKTIKKLILFFSGVSFISALILWKILLARYGSIPSILVHGNEIYRLRVDGVLTGIPYIHILSTAAIFLAGFYTAHRDKINIYSIIPFIPEIVRSMATLGRASIFSSFLLFMIAFFLSRHLLLNKKGFKTNRKRLIITGIVFFALIIGSVTLIKSLRGTMEDFQASSSSLNKLKGVGVISPSIYLYFSSNIGVVDRYLYHQDETAMFGENTFLPFYNFISKAGFVEHPDFYPRGYYMPLWSNGASFIKELHLDFGFAGLMIVPYLLGFLATYLWFLFYEKRNMRVLVLLAYTYLIISFSVFYMITRAADFWLSMITLLLIIPYVEKKNLRLSAQESSEPE